MRFFKNSCKGGGDGKFLLEVRGKPGMGGGGGFTMVGWEIVKVSLHN